MFMKLSTTICDRLYEAVSPPVGKAIFTMSLKVAASSALISENLTLTGTRLIMTASVIKRPISFETSVEIAAPRIPYSGKIQIPFINNQLPKILVRFITTAMIRISFSLEKLLNTAVPASCAA